MQRFRKFGQQEQINALEIAILSNSKRFIATPLVTRVIGASDLRLGLTMADSIYDGTIRYQPASMRGLLVDNHKSLSQVEVYDSRHRPMLDHYRASGTDHAIADCTGLRVPRIRATVELGTFALMTLLYTLCSVRESCDVARCGLHVARVTAMCKLRNSRSRCAVPQPSRCAPLRAQALTRPDGLKALEIIFIVYTCIRLHLDLD